jgi:polyisoprenoid-binding protein YceI
MTRWRMFFASLLFVPGISTAGAAEWIPVPAASRLEFVVTYQGQQAPGVFRQFDVSLALDPDQPSSGRLEVAVFVDSADMNSADINRTIKNPEWFHSSRFPQARFESAEIAKDGSDRYIATGTLSLKGVQRRVVVPFFWRQFGHTASMQGELVLNRNDFGIGTGKWAKGDPIGLDVIVRFSVKLEKKG